MEAVGYEMYSKLLDKAVKELQGVETKEDIDVQIDLPVSAYIPKEYIENQAQKISVYQDIAIAKDEKILDDIIDELIDRFGDIPKEVENLIEVAKIKILARKAGIIDINNKNKKLVIVFNEATFDINIVNKLITKYSNSIMFSPSQNPYMTYSIFNNNDDKKYLKAIQDIIKDIIDI